ncbi:MAG: 23S rRNA (pseudouridine(1915)-N(3))-methyltransferase RlmH [Hyphomicrobiales bacterium]|nr:23S rRNA (pseudouridine(1915)-N(3))-methyltransferase RlmH [Hyphomicrobiales bacterium]
MRLTLAAVGRLKAGPERELVARYVERIAAVGKAEGFSPLALRETEESRARRPEDRKVEEGRALAALFPADAILVALDERGKSMSSADFAARLGGWRDAGVRDLCFVIGGADGLDPAVRAQAALTLSFGALTLPHQIVRALVAEQIYRAISILAGHPYHRV